MEMEIRGEAGRVKGRTWKERDQAERRRELAAKRRKKSEGGGGLKGADRRARAEGMETNGEVNR